MCANSAKQDRRGEDNKFYHRNFVDGTLSRNAMRACSACAGNYEDPDRTAWRPDESDDDEVDDELDDAAEALEEEFPAEK